MVTYDFGSVVSVDRFALWNEEASGVRSFTLLASEDGRRFRRILRNAVPTNNTGNYSADVSSFAATEGRYFRFRASGPEAGAGFNAVAIGEVAFRQAVDENAAVPEPAMLPLIAIGFASLFVWKKYRSRRDSEGSESKPLV